MYLKKYVLVFYNKMFNLDWEFAELTFPEDFFVTPDLKYLDIADAIVFHIPSLEKELILKKKPGQLWIYWSMESDVHLFNQTPPEKLAPFDLFMTYKSEANVPVCYLDYREVQLLRTPALNKSNFVNAFISSDLDKSGRIKYLKELMNFIPVHSYGKKCNNRTIENDNGYPAKLKLISSYKFSLAFENAIQKDYVTEKFFEPLMVGSVPVYLGAPNIEDYAPGDHCYINVNSFKSVSSLAEYLQMLNQNDSLYMEYLAWKDKDYQPEFKKIIEEQNQHPFVRLCKTIRNTFNKTPPCP